MKVICGLGNPGSRYAATRHNVGFGVVDLLARSAGVTRWQNRFEAELADCIEGEHKVLLVKPQTFMNLSGRSLRQLMDFYQATPEDLLVVCDDVNLPLGQMRVRPRGTHGGHNGLRNIQQHLGTTEYARLRIGVGASDRQELADYVLDRFQPGELKVIQDAILRAAQAVTIWVLHGTEQCMNQFNAKES